MNTQTTEELNKSSTTKAPPVKKKAVIEINLKKRWFVRSLNKKANKVKAGLMTKEQFYDEVIALMNVKGLRDENE